MSRPREKRESGEQDLFRSRLDQIINMRHELVRLAQAPDREGVWLAMQRAVERFTGGEGTVQRGDGR